MHHRSTNLVLLRTVYNMLLFRIVLLALVAMRCAAHSTHTDQDVCVCEKVAQSVQYSVEVE